MYTEGRWAHQLTAATASGVVLTTGDKVFWTPGYASVIIRWLSVTVTTLTSTADPATVVLEKRITAGSDTGRVATGMPFVIVPGATAQGKVIYKHGLNMELKAGEELVGRVSDATAAGAGHITIGVELAPVHPGNNPNMILSA